MLAQQSGGLIARQPVEALENAAGAFYELGVEAGHVGHVGDCLRWWAGILPSPLASSVALWQMQLRVCCA